MQYNQNDKSSKIDNTTMNTKENMLNKEKLQNDLIELHADILNTLHNLYVDKNHDYGNSVHDTYKKYGLVSFLVRMEDKLNRVRTLSRSSVKESDVRVQDEKIEDTLLDLANYAILAVMELRLNTKSNIKNNEICTDIHLNAVKEILDQYEKPTIYY